MKYLIVGRVKQIWEKKGTKMLAGHFWTNVSGP